MLSENVHKDDGTAVMAAAETANNWLNTPAFTNAGFGPAQSEQAFGMAWLYNSAAPLAPSSNGMIQRFNREDTSSTMPYMMQGSGVAYLRPASAHPGIFIAVFAGGNTRNISEDIEYAVYQQLMTPNGTKAIAPSSLNTNMADVFMLEPLTDSDY